MLGSLYAFVLLLLSAAAAQSLDTEECGVSTSPGSPEPIIQHSTVTKRGEFPWLVAIYHQNETKLWVQRCGGTLITPHIVLTAAQCVVIVGRVLKAEDVKVGLGKYNRDYYTRENNSVIADVRDIATPAHYVGPVDKFALDIALLDLKQSVQINTFVMPVCVHWDSNHIQPVSLRTVGYVAGWGYTENMTQSDEILSTGLTFTTNADCRKTYSEYSNLIIHDKFCGGSINGSQVSRGVAGGGFTVVMNRQHFVLGVASTKVITSTEISMFTDLKNEEHHQWLLRKRNEFKNFH